VADVQAFLLTLVASLVGLMAVTGGVAWLYKKVFAKTIGKRGVKNI